MSMRRPTGAPADPPVQLVWVGEAAFCGRVRRDPYARGQPESQAAAPERCPDT